MVTQHLERHAQGVYLGGVPAVWLHKNRKFLCSCNRILTECFRHTHNSRCTAVNELPEAAHVIDPQMLPSLHDVMSLNRPTLKHIPGRAKQAWGRTLQNALRDATQNNTVESFTRLAMLPKCVLPSAKRAGKRNTHIKDIVALCEKWDSGQHAELWTEACDNVKSKGPTSNKPVRTRAAQLTRQAAIAFAEDGLYGKASRVLSSKGLAPNTPETLKLLIDKHPAQPSPVVPHTEAEPLQRPPEMNIRAILSSFPKGTACGPTGLRVEHLTDAAEATLPVAFTTTLRHFLNHLISGSAPS
jgi:hypothetical protein